MSIDKGATIFAICPLCKEENTVVLNYFRNIGEDKGYAVSGFFTCKCGETFSTMISVMPLSAIEEMDEYWEG